MIWRLFSLALYVAAFAPCLLHSQQSQPPYVSNSTIATTIDDDSPKYDKMYEDIEILRRILDRQLQSLYPSHTYQTFGMAGMHGNMGGLGGVGGIAGLGGGGLGGIGGMQGGSGTAGEMTTVSISNRSLEGVYLKGQGVVYTATLNSLESAPLQSAKAEKTKPASEWESIRRKVRNEKEEPKKSHASKPPTLSDVLLQVLVENGHHFSQLGDNESLTVVLTVHEANPSSSPRRATGKSMGSRMSGGRGSSSSAKMGSQKGNFGGSSDLRGKVNDLELMGDLHQKQAKYHEAIMEYERAVELRPDPNETPTLYRKLAQCYLALGQDDSARKMLDKLSELLPKSADAKDKPPSADKPAAALPVKLIISAPKRLLQQAQEGKITFEEFRRQAQVKTVGVANNPR